MSIARIKELRLRNYRAFADARLVLDDVTFLVGRNGAGKSTLFDAMSFLSEAVTDSFTTAYERRGGMLGIGPRRLQREAKAGTAVAVRIECDDGTNALYGFEFGFSDTMKKLGILREVLSTTRDPSFNRSESSFRSEGIQLNPVLESQTLVFPLIAGSNDRWKKIIDAIEAASDEFPVVVSTHNPEILSHPSARAERIRVVQWAEGTSNIYPLSKDVLAKLEPPQTVGRLLRANALWTESEPSTVGAEADFFKTP